MNKLLVILIVVVLVGVALLFLWPFSFFFFGLGNIINSASAQQIVDSTASEIGIVSSGVKESTTVSFQPTLNNQQYLVFVSKFGAGNQSKLIVSIAPAKSPNKLLAAAALDLTEEPALLYNGVEKEKLEISPGQECLSVKKETNLVIEKIDC